MCVYMYSAKYHCLYQGTHEYKCVGKYVASHKVMNVCLYVYVDM